MKPKRMCLRCVSLGLAVLFLWNHASAEEPFFQFRDVTKRSGLFPTVQGIHAHGAAWGDVDGDGRPDLYVGTFHKPDSRANLLFLNRSSGFIAREDSATHISSRTTGVLFVDFDNDSDLDLYVASMPAAPGSKLAQRSGYPLSGCSLFQNDKGKFTNISSGNAACPAAFGGRSATTLDFDGDGLLDLFVGEDPIAGYNGSTTTRCRLFRNQGDLQFEDVTDSAGIPREFPGLGVAAADMNNDGLPDLLVACTSGCHLLLNNRKGTFRVLTSATQTFRWPGAKGDNMVCGVSVCDVNLDGRLDICFGQHFERPWQEPVANRLFLNDGTSNGNPTFREVTQEAGIVGLPMKSPHVEFQDFDNDGRVDLYTSVVKFDSEGSVHPILFRNVSKQRGKLQFRVEGLSVNDFPNADDRAVKRTGAFFGKMITDHKIAYTAPGPTADFDRDGRIDLFLGSWWKEADSMLLRNETPRKHSSRSESEGSNWLQVIVQGSDGVNRMGIGSQVILYEAGKLGQTNACIGTREIAVGFGYASGQEAIAHFGLGDRKQCDVKVVLPHSKGVWTRENVAANQLLLINEVADLHR